MCILWLHNMPLWWVMIVWGEAFLGGSGLVISFSQSNKLLYTQRNTSTQTSKKKSESFLGGYVKIITTLHKSDYVICTRPPRGKCKAFQEYVLESIWWLLRIRFVLWQLCGFPASFLFNITTSTEKWVYMQLRTFRCRFRKGLSIYVF